MSNICPIRVAANGFRGSMCTRDSCAWWCDFAKRCAVPLAAEILADSDICNNVWGPVYTKKDGEDDD